MSKLSADQVIEQIREVINGVGFLGFTPTGRIVCIETILNTHAANLAQPEWPSEEDVRKARDAWQLAIDENLKTSCPFCEGSGRSRLDGFNDCRSCEGSGRLPPEDADWIDPMRAALQSVRPPVGVVSEPEWIGSLRNELMQSKSTHRFTFTRDEVMALLASSHAPPKD